MSRALPSAVAAIIDDTHAVEVHLLEFQFSGGTVYITTAAVNLAWNSHTWAAVGGALSVGGIEETADAKAQGVELRMSGVDQTIIALLLTQNYHGRKVIIYRAWIDVNGAIVVDPYIVEQGYMNERWQIEDTPGQAQTPASCVITTRIISRLAEMEWVRGIKTNLTSHQRHFSTDTFFSQTPALQGRKFKWPAS